MISKNKANEDTNLKKTKTNLTYGKQREQTDDRDQRG